MELDMPIVDTLRERLISNQQELDRTQSEHDEYRRQKADEFPATAEEYQALNLPERLRVFRGLIYEYSPDQFSFDSPTAVFDTDDDNAKVYIEVQIDRGKFTNELNSTYTERNPGLRITAHMVAADTGASAQEPVGFIEYPTFENLNKIMEEGEPRITNDPAFVSRNMRREPIDMASDEATQVIEVADAVAGYLITEKVAPLRSIPVEKIY